MRCTRIIIVPVDEKNSGHGHGPVDVSVKNFSLAAGTNAGLRTPILG